MVVPIDLQQNLALAKEWADIYDGANVVLSPTTWYTYENGGHVDDTIYVDVHGNVHWVGGGDQQADHFQIFDGDRDFF